MNENEKPQNPTPAVEVEPTAQVQGQETQAEETSAQAEPTASTAPQTSETATSKEVTTDAAKGEAEPSELERVKSTLTAALTKALDAETRATALAQGVRPDRIAYAVRLADLNGIDITADGAADKISAAIGKVLADVPELKGGVGTGSMGNHPRQAATAEEKNRDDFRRGLNM